MSAKEYWLSVLLDGKSAVSPEMTRWPEYAEARSRAVELSLGRYREKAVRIMTDGGEKRAPVVVAVAMNGRITNPDGTGPDVAP